jgi:hypothetical protein
MLYQPLFRCFCVPCLFIIALALAGGCKKGTSASKLTVLNATVPANFVAHSVDGVTIKTPPDWKRAPGNRPIRIMLFAPDARTNVNLVVTPGEPDLDVAALSRQAPQAMKDKVPGFSLEKNDEVSINNNPAARISYSGSMSGVSLRATQYMIVRGNSVYILTYTAPAAAYQANLPTAEQIAVSMQLP